MDTLLAADSGTDIMTTNNFTHIIIAEDAKGQQVYYTGKAGNNYITLQPRDAFRMTGVGATRTAKKLNRVAGPMHGLTFKALSINP